MRKLNNNGWGFNDFIIAIGLLAICLVVVIIFYNKLINSNNHKKYKIPSFVGEKDNIGNYVELEDKITEQAKLYSINVENDIVIIKFDSLIKNGYINKVVDPKNNKECSGYVIYDGAAKKYKTYLSCPGNYQTSNYNKDFE